MDYQILYSPGSPRIFTNTFKALVFCGHCSVPFKVTSSVPRGGHLFPLLFNNFINDIYTAFQNTKYILLTDDLKLFKVINCVEDCKNL